MKTTIERRNGFIVVRSGKLPPKAIREVEVRRSEPVAVVVERCGSIAADVAKCRGRLRWPAEFLATSMVGEA